MSKPDYAEWLGKSLWFVVDAAQLLADSEPIRPPLAFISIYEQGKAGRAGEIYGELKNAITLNALGFHESRTGELGTRLVEPAECIAWAQKRGLQVPEELRTLATAALAKYRQPDWKHWNACDLLEVWEAIALSIDRDPATITDFRKRLIHGHGRGPITLFDGGAEFDRRMDLLRRAFGLKSSQFVPANDYYGAFGLFEERKVLPGKVRQFLLDKNLAIPRAWTTAEVTPAPASAETETDAAQPWVAHARQIGGEILRANPRLSLEQVADKVHERLRAAGVRGRGNKVLTAATIQRHALQGLKSD
jgi:hypothetical protein